MSRHICGICQKFYDTDEAYPRFCPPCKVTFDKHKEICIKYIESHNNPSIAEISMATNIPIKAVKKLIAEGVLKAL